ncbi:MAG TPA: PadR family transcriptional regulator [Pyrinomonadaceae bacterium]|jgi:DNA-binding PadR family transcriptional regulator|nr:PadR family transcriptional regulator [Pyrinomonadaceae bacterium]
MNKGDNRRRAANLENLDSGNQTRLTTPDLVILSLLAERPMHGYEVNSTLEDRKIREWAPVSRPQIYYSLNKLTKLRLIRVSADDSPAAGPERRVFETSALGRARLADALESKRWTQNRVYQPFLIWLALSWQARPRTFQKQLNTRKQFLQAKLSEERATLEDVMAKVGHPYHEAVWMLNLMIKQREIELQWIDRILKDAHKRAPARNRK